MQVLAMRNARMMLFVIRWAICAMVLVVLSSCTAPSKNQYLLDNGYRALQERQYAEAESDADAYLRAEVNGDSAAEAWYLKGCALQQRDAADRFQSQSNLQAARQAYIAALQCSPSPTLEAYIRASIGNVAFYQDDYVTSVQQLSLSLDGLHNPAQRGYALYRMGLAQQRLGRFADADKTFAGVLTGYPGTAAAQGARDHMGLRAFYVQLAAYGATATANFAAGDVRRYGYAPQLTTNPRGLHVLRIGPFATYEQARGAKYRMSRRFPDATIVP
jgi:tetratricopeptide (TPR) repeat protein